MHIHTSTDFLGENAGTLAHTTELRAEVSEKEEDTSAEKRLLLRDSAGSWTPSSSAPSY